MNWNTGTKQRNSHTKSHSHLCDETKGRYRYRRCGYYFNTKGGITAEGETHWWSWYTYKYTHFIQRHKRHVKDTELKNNVKISWVVNRNPVVCFPCFSPSPPPVEVHFILQFIYTYIVSMHKRIARPNLNDRGALVGSFFFNVGITLTHIGDNLQTQNKPEKWCKTEISVLDVSFLPWSLTILSIPTSFFVFVIFCHFFLLYFIIYYVLPCLIIIPCALISINSKKGQRANLQTIN